MTETRTSKLFAPLADNITNSPAAAEAAQLESWRTLGTFEAVQRARADAPHFVFWEGPPTANGRPGIHHVLARTIKDAVCRFQTMQGKRVVRKAGWDTHGLPVELEVEKKLGISGKPEIEKYGIAQFNAKCRESVWTYRKEWEQLSERTGYWLDYAHPYVTYEEDYVESVWNILARFHQAGLVYRGKRVLPYCGRCGTGLSSHELGQPGVYRDVMDPSVFVRFRLRTSVLDKLDPRLKQAGESESVVAWTTTPWTLPSNIALAVHPEQLYSAIRVPVGDRHEILWLANARIEAPWNAKEFERIKCEGGGSVLATLAGRELVGAKYEPLFDASVVEVDPGAWKPERTKLHTIVAAEYVSMDDGTGVVHQAAAYGVDDWDTARANKLPVLQAVGPEGRFVGDVATVKRGTFFKEADNALAEDLKQRGLLLKKSHESHSYPHCWRCDTPLFYFAVPAWYIRTTAYKDRMIELNRRIRWIPPEVGEKRFGEWLENNIDWNISRDRYWGTPLPFWVCERDEAHELAIGSVAELRERAGKLPQGFDNHKPSIDEVEFACDRCGGTMRRTRAVLDCWFDSGAMPYAQYHWPFGDEKALVSEQFPADFIAEGLDQTRGWFYTLHAIGAFMTTLPEFGSKPQPAYKTCVVNGLLLDKNGVKMSKRLGNVVDPWKTIEEHGADALRWYLVGSGAPWLPKKFDPNGLLEVRRRFFNTLINSYKFFADYARIDDFDPHDPAIPPARERSQIDRWILSRTQSLTREVRALMADYDFAGVCRAIDSFVVDDLSNWYIRRNRRRFWKSEIGADKLAAFATLHVALTTATLLIAPIAPFLSEMLWERLASSPESVHAQRVPEVDERLIDRRLEHGMRVVTRIVEMGRALRERSNLKIRQPLAAIHVRSSSEESLALLRTDFASEQVLAELNVKKFGSLAADDGQLCTLRAKANFRALGKRLGAKMKAAAQVIEALDAEVLARLRAGELVSVTVEGEPLSIGPDDVQVTVETKAAFDVETDGLYIVFLDTQLDEELILEGLAREAINRINGLRKDSGLALEERIELRLDGSSPELKRALHKHSALIAAESLATRIAIEAALLSGGASGEFDLGEGRVLAVSLKRA